MEVRISRASAVVVQHVPAALADWFMEWQRGVTGAAEGFAGYSGTDVYPPGDSERDEWVVVIHFDDEKSLQEWLDSSVRAQWVEKLQAQVGDFELKALPGGFGPWFAGLNSLARSGRLAILEDGLDGASWLISYRHAAHSLSWAVHGAPGTGVGHADRQRPERVHSPVGRDAGAEHGCSPPGSWQILKNRGLSRSVDSS